MNKETKKTPLEAFESIRRALVVAYPLIDESEQPENLNIIETALKKTIVLSNQLEHERKIRIRQEKKLKALEIIKQKLVFYFNDEAKSITIRRNDGFMHITLFFDKQAEYNLLKEVLL